MVQACVFKQGFKGKKLQTSVLRELSVNRANQKLLYEKEGNPEKESLPKRGQRLQHLRKKAL